MQDVALNDLGLDVFPNQIEVISAEQMLDAYSSVGMPLMYSHWSFGKRFVRDEMLYRKGYQALAYEIVINSNPCISYYMEENSMAMQTLVLAHAAFGHNHFFKNNYLFQQWTDANGILDYLEFSKRYVAECEEKFGQEAVESVLDAAHALQNQSVFRYRRANKLNLSEHEARRRERRAQRGGDLQRPLAHGAEPVQGQGPDAGRARGGGAAAAPSAAGREPALFPGEEQPDPAGLAARTAAHRAQRLAIFLPAAPDQADERGLRHLRALSHRQRTL